MRVLEKIIVIGMVLLVASFILCQVYCAGYWFGQRDALYGRWYYMATEQTDGTMTISRLVNPVNRPVIAREK